MPSFPARVLPALLLACTGSLTAMGQDTPAAPPAADAAPAAPAAGPAIELAAYKAALENAKQRIQALEAELTESRQRLAQAQDTLTASGLDPETGEAVTTPAEDPRAAQRRQEQEEARARVQAIREQRAAERAAAQAADAERRANAPKWAYTWQIGFIDGGTRSVTYVKQTPEGQVVFVGEKSTIDRHSVLLRGTFENKSTQPYRYTFDVGVFEDNSGNGFFHMKKDFTSHTRYQTPVLQPGELHAWELKLSVKNAWTIQSAGIGNVRADAVEPAPMAPPAAEDAPTVPSVPPSPSAGRG